MKKLILALDIYEEKKALDMVKALSEYVDIFKVGPILFLKSGPSIVGKIKKLNKEVFLDLKFHDIPQTVKRAVQSAADLGVYSLTLHSSGGKDMIAEASSIQNRPKLWAVTVLTSQETKPEKVVELAILAKESGADGVIASPLEIGLIKKECGREFTVVTPGIRIANANDDQKRVAAPSSAIKAGADFIVVGRPIIEAENPKEAAKKIYEEISKL
ncbi:MAG: orotidine-5'-phosphate decarboxylase [Elusimicrobia bacterium]|nr:orotidine-5'-phosphate decarboxylase [Candidatus Liberimonas magnetica]